MKKKTLSRILCNKIINWKTGERGVPKCTQTMSGRKVGGMVGAPCQSKAVVEDLRNLPIRSPFGLFEKYKEMFGNTRKDWNYL